MSTWSLHACPPTTLPTSTPSPRWCQEGVFPTSQVRSLTGASTLALATIPPFLCLQTSAIRPAGLLGSRTGTRETSAHIPQPSLVLS